MSDGSVLVKNRRARTAMIALAALVGSGLLLAAPATASAETSSSSTTGTAVLTPLLRILDFGAVVGLPEGCETGFSVLGAGAGELRLSTQVSPLIGVLDNACQNISQNADTYIQKAITASYQADGLNAMANPVIAEMAASLVTVGGSYGSSLAPFGPTISGLAGTVAFFEGT